MAQNYSDFGLEVRTALLRQGKSLTWLAEQLGCSTGFLSDMLKGNRQLITKENNWPDKIREVISNDKARGAEATAES